AVLGTAGPARRSLPPTRAPRVVPDARRQPRDERGLRSRGSPQRCAAPGRVRARAYGDSDGDTHVDGQPVSHVDAHGIPGPHRDAAAHGNTQRVAGADELSIAHAHAERHTITVSPPRAVRVTVMAVDPAAGEPAPGPHAGSGAGRGPAADGCGHRGRAGPGP